VSEHDELRKLADRLRDAASVYELSGNSNIQDLCMAIGEAADGLDAILSHFPDSSDESRVRKLIDRAVYVCQRAIVPDGLTDKEAMSEMYGIFDGPEHRAAIADLPATDEEMRKRVRDYLAQQCVSDAGYDMGVMLDEILSRLRTSPATDEEMRETVARYLTPLLWRTSTDDPGGEEADRILALLHPSPASDQGLREALERYRDLLSTPIHPESGSEHDHDIETGRYMAWVGINHILMTFPGVPASNPISCRPFTHWPDGTPTTATERQAFEEGCATSEQLREALYALKADVIFHSEIGPSDEIDGCLWVTSEIDRHIAAVARPPQEEKP
jgi:hypothetical protein